MIEPSGADAEDWVGELYEQYADDVFIYARMTLGDEADAADVVQEVFLRAFRAWGSYRHASSPRTWLMSITRNYLTDVLRRRQSEGRHLATSASTRTTGDVPEQVAPGSPMDVVVEVQELLAKLRPTYRQVVVLRYMDNFSLTETAHILGWSEAKVRTTASRAMHKLRELMTARDEEDALR